MSAFSQMARNLADDFEQNGTSWPTEAVRDVANALTLLRERSGIVGESETPKNLVGRGLPLRLLRCFPDP